MENAELLKKLMELTKTDNPPPEGWLTAEQWAKKWRISQRTARGYLSVGVKRGMLEKRMFRPLDARQILPHFREVGCDGTAVARGCGKTSGTPR